MNTFVKNNSLLLAKKFNPQNIPGIVQWYDASDESTMTLNSTAISEWRSKVGQGFVSQNSADSQPTLTANYYNSLSAVTFDGNDFLYNASLSVKINGMTIGAILDETTRVAYGGIVGGALNGSGDTNPGGFRLSVHTGVNLPINLYSNVSGNVVLNPLPQDETNAIGKNVVVARISPSDGSNGNGNLRLNSVSGPTDLFYGIQADTESMIIGGRIQSGIISNLGRFNGKILEIVIWDRSLTLEEIQIFENYARNKWGVTS